MSAIKSRILQTKGVGENGLARTIFSVYFATSIFALNIALMIDQIFEFIGNHLILVGIFAVLLIAFTINEGKRGGATVTISSLVTMINREDATVLDIRDSKDFSQGHIIDAINMPYSSFEQRSGELEKLKDKPLVVVCKMGQHAGAIGRKLKAQGFEDVKRLSGGMAEWSASNLPVVKR